MFSTSLFRDGLSPTDYVQLSLFCRWVEKFRLGDTPLLDVLFLLARLVFSVSCANLTQSLSFLDSYHRDCRYLIRELFFVMGDAVV